MSRNPWAAVWVTALCVCFMAVVVAPAALAYDSPAPQPNADPSHPVKLDPNKVYPDQPDVPSLGTTPRTPGHEWSGGGSCTV